MALTDGYLHWEQQLNGRMGFQVTPMSVEQRGPIFGTSSTRLWLTPVPECLED